MKINSAADLAAVLDPERKNAGWWKRRCQECGELNAHNFKCRRPRIEGEWVFIGPPDLHTARKYAYLMEEWLEAHGVMIARETERRTSRDPFITTAFKHRASPDMREGMRKILGQDTNHTAALVAAIERVTG